jgi:hypothetical protein
LNSRGRNILFCLKDVVLPFPTSFRNFNKGSGTQLIKEVAEKIVKNAGNKAEVYFFLFIFSQNKV